MDWDRPALPCVPIRGFTVFEVLIVAATMAAVTAVALPSYVNQLHKSARAEAQTFMVRLAESQQRLLATRGRYATDLASLDIVAPANLVGKYAFAVAAAPEAPQQTFTLTAAAIGEQSKDACPSLTLKSTGARWPEECW